MNLYDAMNEYKAASNSTVKRAMLIICNELYRQEMGLTHSKPTPQVNTTPNADEVYLGKYNGKIPMIKAHRTRTNLGLCESKQICENYFNDNGLEFYY